MTLRKHGPPPAFEGEAGGKTSALPPLLRGIRNVVIAAIFAFGLLWAGWMAYLEFLEPLPISP